MRVVVVGVMSALLGGCIYVGWEDTTVDRKRGEHWDPPAQLSDSVPIIALRPAGTAVEIAAEWRRTCEWTGTVDVETTTSTGARLRVADPTTSDDKNGYGIVLGILFAPATLLLSGLVTLAVVSGSHDQVVVARQNLPSRTGPCDAVGAGMTIDVFAPGREPVRVVTDPAGRARVELGDAAAARAATAALAH